jgi:tRNA (guanine-N7-)-methyltransferase
VAGCFPDRPVQGSPSPPTAPTAVATARTAGAPPVGNFSWRDIFSRTAEVSVEIGPGRGDFFLALAAKCPQADFFAIERSPRRARALAERIAKCALHNGRVLCADAACVVTLLPNAVVERYFVLFPDPWWKRRHRHRRVWTAAFIDSIARTLRPAGSLHFLTDVEEYYTTAREQLDVHPEFECVEAGPRPDVSTEFARKARRRGGAVYGAIYLRRW